MKYILIVFSVLFLFSCSNNEVQTFESEIHTSIPQQIDSLNFCLNELANAKDKPALILHFKSSRKYYKQIEPFVEYYFQGLSRRINGPALPEIKTDDNIINDASGFQVIEELVFAEQLDFGEIEKQVSILKTDLLFIQKNFKDLPVQPLHFYELIQHQIIRIATLGITGFDSPVAFNSIEESANALEGIMFFYQKYSTTYHQAVNVNFLNIAKQSIQYLHQQPDFEKFNRLIFIKNYLMPLSESFEKEFQTLLKNNAQFNENKVFYGHLSNLMKGEKLNPDAFSPYADSKSSKPKTELGKLLFADHSLSRSNTMSCASCHMPEKAFTDGKKVSNSQIHNDVTQRNSPTLYYAAFQKSFFYDMRSSDLENQIESVMNNPNEFNLSPKEIHQKIAKNKLLMSYFAEAFPQKKEIGPYEIRNALASYVRSLMPFKAKIDRFFAGKTNLTTAEEHGFNLFTGKAKCATCHFAPIYNGTVPPWFNNSESEVIGVPENIKWTNARINPDVGRYQFNQLPQLQYAFKTPTLRNIEKTAPYMHNGVYQTLEEVIKFYELGGGNGIGMNLEHQTLPFDHLKLTDQEKKDIVSFLKTLTDGD